MGPTSDTDFLEKRKIPCPTAIRTGDRRSRTQYIPRSHTTLAAPPSDTTPWQILKSGQAHVACCTVLYQRRPESTAQWNSSIQMPMATVIFVYLQPPTVNNRVG